MTSTVNLSFASLAIMICVSVAYSYSQYGYFNTPEKSDYLNMIMNVDLTKDVAPEPSGNKIIASCPTEVNISWLQAPPFVYRDSDDNQTGVLNDIFRRAVIACCGKWGGTVPKFKFLERAPDLKALREHIINGQADVIFPVQSDDEAKYGGRLPYIKVLDSPGVVLIQPRASLRTRTSMWKAVLGTCPVIVMAFSLSSLAGVLIWLMDTWQNSEQFPRKFYRGAFEGFWWAVVTMSTVGYGDKTPKSVLARLFAVVWILIGITICSVMTASLSSALTSVTIVESYDVTTGKKIGVLRDSVAFENAVNLAANIKDFESLDDLYDSLSNGSEIDGVVEELFAGIEFLKMKDKSKSLSVSKFIQHTRGHGVAYKNNLFPEQVSHCLSNVIRFRSADVIYVTSQYLKTFENTREKTADEHFKPANAFDSQPPLFKGIAVASSVSLLIVLVFGVGYLALTKWFRPQKRNTHGMVGDDKDIKRLSTWHIQTEV